MNLKKMSAIALAVATSFACAPSFVFADSKVATDGEYLLMNIPYSEFYEKDLNNDVKVDAMSSATKTKTRTKNMNWGSYHVDPEGSDITGVTFPVKVSGNIDLSNYTEITDDDSLSITTENRGQSSTITYEGKDALYEADSYSYYVLDDSETPSYYKTVTEVDGKLEFSALEGNTDVTEMDEVDVSSLNTNSSYGDYQLDLEGIDTYFTNGTDKLYGVVLSTEEGNDYALRHLENVWLGSKLAWSTGFTTSVHGSPLSSDHYKAMMGQTITSITYYTENGVYTKSDLDIYVPVKTGATASLSDVDYVNGTAKLDVTLPEDFDAVYSVDGLSDVAYNNGTLTFTGASANSNYTLTISDASGKYASLTAAFPTTIATATATLEQDSYTYTGSAITPAVSVVFAGRTPVTLTEGTDYTVAYANNVNAGTATVTITGAGSYVGTITKEFTIEPAAIDTVQLSTTSYTYSGSTKKPAVYVYSGNTKLSSSSYTVKYPSSSKYVGVYTVTVTGKGNYTGSATATFTIKPKGTSISKAKSYKGKLKVYVKKQKTQTSGYEIQYSKSKSFTSAKTVTISTKYTSKTISKLSKKTYYYVRVRTYKTVSGKKVYSSYSSAKKYKTK